MVLSEVLVPESSVVQLRRVFVMRTIDLDIHYDGLTTVIAIDVAVGGGGDDSVVTGGRGRLILRLHSDDEITFHAIQVRLAPHLVRRVL